MTCWHLTMLACRCVLRGKNEDELTKLGAHRLMTSCLVHPHVQLASSCIALASLSRDMLQPTFGCFRALPAGLTLLTGAGECPLDPGGYFIVRVSATELMCQSL